MSEEVMEVETEVVETAEATETESVDTPKEEVNEVEQPPELTPEERIKKLEADVTGKQSAIDRQTKRYYETQEKLQKIQEENAKLLSQLKQAEPESAPDIDNFETHDEYVEALAEYKAKTKLQEQQKQFAEQQRVMQEQAVMQERLALRQQQEAEYIKENPMYKASVDEVQYYIQNLGESPNGTVDAVLTQVYKGNVPEVIDYFGRNNGENLEQLGKISKMTPPEAAVEIYKIQQKLAANPSVKKEVKTPPKPVTAKKGDKANTSGLGKHSSGEDVLKSLGLK